MAEATDFFVSYTSADSEWAEWIAWQLEGAGYTTVLQAWDSLPGDDFISWMNRNIRSAKRILIVLSPAYEKANSFTVPEWTTALGRDPTGEHGALLPVRIRNFTPEGLLRTRVWVDLVDKDEEAARTALLKGVRRERLKPSVEPRFPGHPSLEPTTGPKPQFPGLPLAALRSALELADGLVAELHRLVPPVTHGQLLLLGIRLNEAGESLHKPELVRAQEWSDLSWAIELTETRKSAERSIRELRENLKSGSELQRYVHSAVLALDQFRDLLISRHPELLTP